MVPVACCKLQVACCTLHVASPGYAKLHGSRCLPRRTRCGCALRALPSTPAAVCNARSAVRCGEPNGAERSPIACRPLRFRAFSVARCPVHVAWLLSLAHAVVVCGVRCSAQLYDLTADGAEQSPISDATALATLEALQTNNAPACTMHRPQSSTQQATCNADGVELGTLGDTHRTRTVCSPPTANRAACNVRPHKHTTAPNRGA